MLGFARCMATGQGRITHQNVAQFDPYAVNAHCPRVIACRTDNGGFGDQLEHFVYCMQAALDMNATVMLDDMSFLESGHKGAEEYLEASGLLGITVLGNAPAQPDCQGGFVKPAEIWGCGDAVGGWCHNVHSRRGILNSVLLSVLRRNGAVHSCATRLDPPLRAGLVNVVFHVRAGDVCLHCDDVPFVRSVLGYLSGLRTHVIFESSFPLPEMQAAFPQAEFRRSGLLGAVCLMLLGDILVTTGSSLPAMVAAFAPPSAPLVFEELRKEAQADSRNAPHFFSADNAVLLKNGVVQNPGFLARALAELAGER
jgi:hypothetical protein